MSGFSVTGVVKTFSQPSGWFYVEVPRKITSILLPTGSREFVPITATRNTSTWNTSLLPMGNGAQFIAIKKSIRTKEGVELGSRVTVTFEPRHDF